MNLVHGEKENKMNKLKKIKLGKSEFLSKLSKEQMLKVLGGSGIGDIPPTYRDTTYVRY